MLVYTTEMIYSSRFNINVIMTSESEIYQMTFISNSCTKGLELRRNIKRILVYAIMKVSRRFYLL